MKNPNIGATLRTYRKNNNLSVNQVSQILKEHNNYAAPKTIYGWESGHTQPDADTLMLLCKVYHIDNLLEAFGYREGPDMSILTLTPKERLVILQYRAQPELQYGIDRMLGIEKAPELSTVAETADTPAENAPKKYPTKINYLDKK